MVGSGGWEKIPPRRWEPSLVSCDYSKGDGLAYSGQTGDSRVQKSSLYWSLFPPPPSKKARGKLISLEAFGLVWFLQLMIVLWGP